MLHYFRLRTLSLPPTMPVELLPRRGLAFVVHDGSLLLSVRNRQVAYSDADSATPPCPLRLLLSHWQAFRISRLPTSLSRCVTPDGCMSGNSLLGRMHVRSFHVEEIDAD